MSGRLIDLLHGDRRPRVLVVGDVMLDRYLFGDVDRISPEAPIPVLRVGRREDRLGGAGSVAAMLAALEAEPVLAAVLGDDPEGRTVGRLLRQIGVDSQAVVTAADRVTTVKERLLGRTHSKQPQQMIRVDREQSQPIGTESAERLLASIQELIDRVDLLLVSDYDKGVCQGCLVRRVVELAAAADVPVVADPVRDVHYDRYRGCTGLTPNRVEAGLAAATTITTPEAAVQAARLLLRFGVEAVVVTLDRDGIAWADQRGNAQLFPARRPRQVYDVTGAGDMVLSALGYALACGADWPTAIELANLAGGLQVERLGVVPISRPELLTELGAEAAGWGRKIVPIERLQTELARHRRRGEQIVMTNGCFDLLHPGHVASLQAARTEGDLLVVGLNSDRSVRALKGPGHPIVDQRGRAEMLAALACVDYVVVFDEPSVEGLVRHVLPDVLVKSAQYAHDQVVGHQIVERHGGRVVRVPMNAEYSTSGLVAKIRATAEHPDAVAFSLPAP